MYLHDAIDKRSDEKPDRQHLVGIITPEIFENFVGRNIFGRRIFWFEGRFELKNVPSRRDR